MRIEERLKPLDSMRGIAAIIIACMHHYYYVFARDEANPLYQVPVLWTLTRYGSCLVEMFFIISGLLAYLFYFEKLHKREISPKKFMFRRILRLFPVMYLSFAIMAIVQWISLAINGYAIRNYAHDGFHFVLNLFGLQYGWFDLTGNFNQTSWYISVLLFCYLVFTIECGVQKRNNTGNSNIQDAGNVSVFFVVLIAGFFLYRSGWKYPVLNSVMGRGLYTFSIGVLLGWFLKIDNEKIHKIASKGCWGLLFLAAMLYSLQKYVRIHFNPDADIAGNYSLLLSFVVYPALIYLSITSRTINRLMSFPPLVQLGKYSYSLYLLNFPIYVLEHYVIDWLKPNVNYSSLSVFLL